MPVKRWIPRDSGRSVRTSESNVSCSSPPPTSTAPTSVSSQRSPARPLVSVSTARNSAGASGWSSRSTNDRCNRRGAGRTCKRGAKPSARRALASADGPLRHRLQPAPPAGTRAPSGTGAAPAAASGTRWSRRRAAAPSARAAGRARRSRGARAHARSRSPRSQRPGGGAPRHRHRRARPRARRRPRARLAGPDRRLARDRQVHAHQRRARQPRGARAQGALRLRRGVGGAGQAARRAPRAARAERADRRRDRPRRGARHDRGRAPRGLRDRLRAGALRPGADGRARLGRPGARGGRPADARGQGARHRRRCSSAT